MFRFSVLLAFALCLTGCKDLETKKVSSEVLAEEELKAINMNEVDEYPSFAACDSIEAQEARYQCFKTELALNFQRQLSNKTIIVESELNDTIWLYLSITELGDLSIDRTEIPDTIAVQLPELERWLKDSLDSLPQISAANKRGIPVKTAFKMPVIVKVD
ncbi:MAG: hypothetical protein ABGW88_14985 [Leeuwenhoekiella sp.]|jgi:hypothetical protein|uniref:hypothetical protein n=1 Tax=Leeuwenhoekiella TaxID=283735 RepID=UPI000C5F18AB|nr:MULTISPECIES: hypothetical protein [Leeuwenhoekiella]MAO42579.1 hypothetical protein [Leeuwenhoekiella sp.]HBT08721.1 hypothetical protein [Leeuwenhoekiella sp.]HCW64429.1 hypothetical protein [Leeuwenhoekiella sp.]|tara:strand:- start:5947 stop:6426 length:480 start_codon:yes stop_codon:yes gene_type:complete